MVAGGLDDRDFAVEALDEFDFRVATVAEFVRADELDRLSDDVLAPALEDFLADLLGELVLVAPTRVVDRLDLDDTAFERLEPLDRRLRPLRALRRVRRTAGFQPSARSERNEAGMEST